MLLEPPTTQQLAVIRESTGFNEEQLKEAVAEIKKWLEEQPHLPNVHEEARLKLLFLHCKGNMEKVQESLDIYYSMKAKIPDVLSGRDSLEPWFKDTKDVYYALPLPTLTDDTCRIVIGGLLDQSLSKFNLKNILRMSYMVHDALYMEEFCPRAIYIIDAGSSPSHLAKFPFSVLKKIYNFGLIGYRVQFKSAHFINAPIYFNILIAFIKFILKPKLFERVYVHRNGVGSLYDYVPQRLLPNEYGGNAGPLREMWEAWVQELVRRRDWFMEHDNYRTDESKRPRKK